MKGVVTPGLRILPTPAITRRLALLLVVLGGLLVGLEATPARASVTEVEGVKVGLQSPEMARYWEGPRKWTGYGHEESNSAAESFASPAGHPVMHTVKTYAIYWDPQDYYHGDWQGLIDGFLANVAGTGGQLASVFAVDGQYTDLTNQPAATHSSFMGAYTDTNAYPRPGCVNPQPLKFGAPLAEASPPCLTDKQVKEQLEGFIAGHGLQKGMGTIFYLLTPPGVAVCLNAGGAGGHCSDFGGSPNEVSQYEEDEHTYPERLAEYKKALEAWEEEKAAAEAKKETFEVPPPVEPKEPQPPAGYTGYLHSFCSYHSDISPTNPESGDGNTILYAVIPWSAGEEGDYHIDSGERSQGYDCQDGGFQPNSKPGAEELEEKEAEKPRTPKEEEEFAQKSTKEKREIEEAKALGLDKTHEQEPNQIGLGPDGSYDTGLADLIINQVAVEQQNTITNPLLNAWQDKAGREVTDECRNFFVFAGGETAANPLTHAGTLVNQQLGGKGYYVNDAFDLAALKLPYPAIPCLHDISLEPQFTAPVFANSGEVVGFNGMESDITLDAGTEYSEKGEAHAAYARYTWNFGDGSAEKTGYAPGAPPGEPSTLCELPWLPPCDASVFHSYQYGGTYDVTLTVRDVGGNVTSVTHPIVVAGPPPPGSGAPAAGPGAGSPGASANGGAGSGTKTSVTLPAPVARAAAVSSSLERVAHNGLVVHYSVNEQVAGRFEVLLNAATAHHLKIGGRVATKLPTGTPRSLVIGQALLVTTKAGRSSVRIKFGKSTAGRLRRAHKVTLMLRLTAHNASPQNPLFTTVLNTVVLHG